MSLFALADNTGAVRDLPADLGMGDNVVTRYLAEASFWVYLVHLPFVGLTQIAIAELPVPTVAKSSCWREMTAAGNVTDDLSCPGA